MRTLETERGRLACAQITVVSQIGRRHRVTRRGQVGAPVVGHSGTLVEGQADTPAADRRTAAVAHRHIRNVTVTPGVGADGATDTTATAARR